MKNINETALRDFVSQQIFEMVGDKVDLEQDFCGAGGDSFDAVMLTLALKVKYGLTISANEIIDADSIFSLCERLANVDGSPHIELRSD